jgi:hypothetical protein
MEDSPEYKATPKSKKWRFLLLMVLVNVLVSTGSVYVYDRYFAVHVVAFDITGYVMNQKKAFFKKEITEDELYKSLDRVDFLLNSYVEKRGKNTLILNGNAVIKNAKFIKP